MDYETGKNFEKVQALLEEHEDKIKYLMIKLGERPVAKKPVVKTVKTKVVETEEVQAAEPEVTKEDAQVPKDEAVEDIVEQEYEAPTVKAPKPKKRWGRKTEEEEEAEPARIL